MVKYFPEVAPYIGVGNPDEIAKAVGLSTLLYSSAGQPGRGWESRTKARGSETQDTPSGPWPPSTATWRHTCPGLSSQEPSLERVAIEGTQLHPDEGSFRA